jgi:tetratricopeptide (TPR) repeat protein
VERIKRIGDKLYEFMPRTTDTLTAQLLFQQALNAEKDPEPDNPLELYYRALSYDPTLAMAWINIGTIHFHWRDFVMAEECYRKAIAIDPKYAMAQFDLANVLEEQKQLKEAIEHYCEAIALDPPYPDAHYNLALIYMRIDEAPKAIKHFRLYLHHQNGDDEAWAHEARRNIQRLSQRIGIEIVRKKPASITVIPREPIKIQSPE